jgi:hypothetical protein
MKSMLPDKVIEDLLPGYLGCFDRKMLERLILADNPNIETLIQEQKEREKLLNKFRKKR